MNISIELEASINQQIGVEMAASYSYLSMASYFERTGYDGFAHWMHLQSSEEHAHAMKFYHYLLDRGGVVRLPPIGEVRWDYGSTLEVFEEAYRQECSVTKHIYGLCELAQTESDFATSSFLKWFLDEQVEEEKAVSGMVDKLKLAKGNPEALLLLDRYARDRTQAPTA